MNILNKHINEISQLCKAHHVKELYAFGSVVDEKKFNDKSDIDFIVKFNDDISVEEYADNYFDLQFAFKSLLKREIDLVTKKSIKNPVFKRIIDNNKVQLYAHE